MKSGRQKCFDTEVALEAAMMVFWQRGFVGASLSDLTGAMGLNKPSLYATYGNKEELFIKAIDCYIEKVIRPYEEALEDDSVDLKDRLKDYITKMIGMQCDKSTPGGCFISLSLGECSSDLLPEKAKAAVLNVRDEILTYFKKVVIKAKERGRLESTIETEAMVSMILTLLHGAASMARSGYKEKEIVAAMDLALSVLD